MLRKGGARTKHNDASHTRGALDPIKLHGPPARIAPPNPATTRGVVKRRTVTYTSAPSMGEVMMRWTRDLFGTCCGVALCVVLAACTASSAGEDGGGRETDSGSERGGRIDDGLDAGPVRLDAGAATDASAPTPDAVDADSQDAGTTTDVRDDAALSDAGPDAAPEDVGVDTTPPLPTGAIGGVVWAPGQAPGQVPAGQEIPVSDALVYLSIERPAAIPQRAFCQACQTPPRGSVSSDERGRFLIEGMPVGDYWLVMEKGQFRREVQVTLEADRLIATPDEQTTLPSRNDPANGSTTPRIALAGGSYDHLEDILGKMGLGDVDTSGRFVPESADGVFDVYDNGQLGAVAVGTLAELVRDVDRMLDYHIIFIPCGGSSNTSALQEQRVLQNIREYVAAGGNLYVTDWSGEWHDNVFPAHIEYLDDGGGFGPGLDTPASAWDPETETWDTSLFGTTDGSSYNTPNADAVDEGLRAWLDGQLGPTAESARTETYDATHFDVVGSFNAIVGVHDVVVGEDRLGDPIVDSPRVWVTGGSTFAPEPKQPLTVTYEPVGCGRVLYSTYHTTDDTHLGLAPQERVLLYLIMEIGTCRDPKL